jgi:hypothetical protein
VFFITLETCMLVVLKGEISYAMTLLQLCLNKNKRNKEEEDDDYMHTRKIKFKITFSRDLVNTSAQKYAFPKGIVFQIQLKLYTNFQDI